MLTSEENNKEAKQILVHAVNAGLKSLRHQN